MTFPSYNTRFLSAGPCVESDGCFFDNLFRGCHANYDSASSKRPLQTKRRPNPRMRSLPSTTSLLGDACIACGADSEYLVGNYGMAVLLLISAKYGRLRE
jgi:hypothetical protein